MFEPQIWDKFKQATSFHFDRATKNIVQAGTLGAGTFLFGTVPSLLSENLLPYGTYVRPTFPWENDNVAYRLTEPILSRQARSFNLDILIDWEFLARFSESVERTYFGRATYRSGSIGDWIQMLFRNINDLSSLGLERVRNTYPFKPIAPCEGNLTHMLDENTLPLKFWLSRVDSPEYSLCMDDLIELFVPGKKNVVPVPRTRLSVQTRFWRRPEGGGHGGSEGSHPDLLIHPQFTLRPPEK